MNEFGKLLVIKQSKKWARLVHMSQGDDKLLLKIFEYVVDKGCLDLNYLEVKERVFFHMSDILMADLKNARRRAEHKTLMQFSIVPFDGVGEIMVTRLPDRPKLK